MLSKALLSRCLVGLLLALLDLLRVCLRLLLGWLRQLRLGAWLRGLNIIVVDVVIVDYIRNKRLILLLRLLLGR